MCLIHKEAVTKTLEGLLFEMTVPRTQVGKRKFTGVYKPFSKLSAGGKKLRRKDMRQQWKDEGICLECYYQELLLEKGEQEQLYKEAIDSYMWSDDQIKAMREAKAAGCKASMPGLCLECNLGLDCTF